MASRYRNATVATIKDRENIVADTKGLQIKTKVVGHAPLLRRPALNDLGNTLNDARKAAAGKKAVAQVAPQPKKPPHTTKDNEEVIEDDKLGYSAKQLEFIDPDADCQDDPQMVTEYVGDIFNYLRELENKYPVKEKYLEGHQSTPRMRSILVNWLVQVHQNFKLCIETLHICVNIIDRYLQQNKSVGRDTLQLVGTASLLIACKYEEMYFPDLSDFVYICDDTFSKKQILKMEIEILSKLGCSLGRPVSMHFLRRYNKIIQARPEHHNLGKYLLELALVDYAFVHVKPSVQAAAACCLSYVILNDDATVAPSSCWSPTLEHYTTYTYAKFAHVVTLFAQLLVKAETTKHKAVKEKYASSAFGRTSLNPKLYGKIVKKLAID